MVYILTDAAERDEFIQFVQNPTPGSKWDTFARKIPPNKTSKGRKKLKNSPKKPKKEEGCKPSKNAKEEDSEDYDGIAGNASHTKSTISKKRSKEEKKQLQVQKQGKIIRRKVRRAKQMLWTIFLVILVKFDI